MYNQFLQNYYNIYIINFSKLWYYTYTTLFFTYLWPIDTLGWYVFAGLYCGIAKFGVLWGNDFVFFEAFRKVVFISAVSSGGDNSTNSYIYNHINNLTITSIIYMIFTWNDCAYQFFTLIIEGISPRLRGSSSNSFTRWASRIGNSSVKYIYRLAFFYKEKVILFPLLSYHEETDLL